MCPKTRVRKVATSCTAAASGSGSLGSPGGCVLGGEEDDGGIWSGGDEEDDPVESDGGRGEGEEEELEFLGMRVLGS